MTYEQLVVLHAIVTEGTFRGAAVRLNKSQSAISHMLKKLEEEIELELLSRAGYRPKLTPAGDVFYRQATRVLQQMQQLSSVAKNLSAKQEAEVFLAVTTTCPLTCILRIIGEVRNGYPTTHIRLARESMGGPVERLMRQDADIIIASMDGVPVDEVEAVPFMDIVIMKAAHADYEPAKSSHIKTIAEMQSYTQVVVADSSSGEFQQSRGLLPGGLRWTVSDFAAKKEILLSKMGWGGIPTHMIEKELEDGVLVPLHIEGFAPQPSQLFKIRRRDHNAGIVAQTIWEQLI